MQWCWELRNDKGRVIGKSRRGHDNRADCLNEVDEIRKKVAHAPIKGFEG